MGAATPMCLAIRARACALCAHSTALVLPAILRNAVVSSGHGLWVGDSLRAPGVNTYRWMMWSGTPFLGGSRTAAILCRSGFDRVLTLLDIYGIDDAEERRAYVTLAREANQQGWWSTFGDALGNGHFVGLESEASAIRTYESMTIPGLLQTPEYARAVRGSGHQRLRRGRYASSTAGLPGTGRLPGRSGHPRNGLKRNRRTVGADAFARHLLIPFECPREFFDAPRPRENHARFQVVESVRSSRWGEAGSFEPARCAGTKGGRTLW